MICIGLDFFLQTLITWWSVTGDNFRKLHFWLHPLIHIFVSTGCSCNGLRYWHHSEEDTWLTLEFLLIACTPCYTYAYEIEQSLAVQILHSILEISSRMYTCWYESYVHSRPISYLLLRLLSFGNIISYQIFSDRDRSPPRSESSVD